MENHYDSLSNNKLIQTILYSEDQIIIAKSEDELPTAACQIKKNPARKYSMKRPSSKTETMAMCGKNL
jgi:beta-xylosidase